MCGFFAEPLIAVYVVLGCLILLGLALVGIIQVPIYIFILPIVGAVDFFYLSYYRWNSHVGKGFGVIANLQWEIGFSLFYCGIVTALLSFFGIVPLPFYYLLPVVGVGAILYFKEDHHTRDLFDGSYARRYSKATEADPGTYDGWVDKGDALRKLGKDEEAIESYGKAIEINPKDALAWYNKGSALANLGKYEQAIKCYDKSIEIDPHDVAGWYNKIFALQQLSKYEEAIVCCDKAIEIDPHSENAWNIKKLALEKLGQRG